MRVATYYAERGIDADVEPFFRDVPRRMSEAQIIISRSGASSVADISVIGRPSILIPFAAATGDHQTANARGLVDVGGAILIPEKRLQIEALAEQISNVIEHPDGSSRMARAAFSCAMTEAPETLANMVEDLAGLGAEMRADT